MWGIHGVGKCSRATANRAGIWTWAEPTSMITMLCDSSNGKTEKIAALFQRKSIRVANRGLRESVIPLWAWDDELWGQQTCLYLLMAPLAWLGVPWNVPASSWFDQSGVYVPVLNTWQPSNCPFHLPTCPLRLHPNAPQKPSLAPHQNARHLAVSLSPLHEWPRAMTVGCCIFLFWRSKRSLRRGTDFHPHPSWPWCTELTARVTNVTHLPVK